MHFLIEKDAKIADNFIKKYYKNIIEKWIKFFVLKKVLLDKKRQAFV